MVRFMRPAQYLIIGILSLFNHFSFPRTLQAVTDRAWHKLPDFMASLNGRKNESQRSRPVHVSKSFSKLESANPDRTNRSTRARTIQNGAMLEGVMYDRIDARASEETRVRLDAFEQEPQGERELWAGDEDTGKQATDFDELPIELISLTDR